MARALATPLMLLKRWADLPQTLRIALRAGEQLGDLEAIGWAKHELGSLHLAAGDVKRATRDLRQARQIREQIGDRPGRAATNRNLQTLCNRLQTMVQNDELMRRQARGKRPPLRYLLAGATLAAFLFAGGVATGMVADGGGNRENAADEGVVTSKHPGSKGGGGPSGGGNAGGNGSTGGGTGRTGGGGGGTGTGGTTREELEKKEQREAEQRETEERERAERELKEQAQREAEEAGPIVK